MRKSVEESRKRRLVLTAVSGILSCIGAMFLCVTIFSSVAAIVDLNAGGYTLMSGLALCAGCFAAAYTVAKKRRRRGLCTGLVCGGAVFAAVFIVGLIFVRSFSAGGFFFRLVSVMLCSAVGGVIGVNSRRGL